MHEAPALGFADLLIQSIWISFILIKRPTCYSVVKVGDIL